MSSAVFVADPLLGRAAPKPSQGGFDVQALLAPVRAGFAPDPLLAIPLAPEAMQAMVDGSAETDGERAEGNVDSRADPPGVHLPAVEPTAWPAEVQALLEQRYREGFEEGLAQVTAGADSTAADLGDGHPGLARERDRLTPEGSVAGSDPGVTGQPRDTVLLLESLSRALQPLLLPDDAATRFEPLKRLSLHLAMELVRQELSVSPRVVDELVRRCVQALQAGEQAPLTVELHPQDLALLQHAWDDPATGLPVDAAMRQRVNWVEDPELARGSVRARSDASMVEDLIQHRLASIVQDLRIQSLQWQQDETQLQKAAEAGGADA